MLPMQCGTPGVIEVPAPPTGSPQVLDDTTQQPPVDAGTEGTWRVAVTSTASIRAHLTDAVPIAMPGQRYRAVRRSQFTEPTWSEADRSRSPAHDTAQQRRQRRDAHLVHLARHSGPQPVKMMNKLMDKEIPCSKIDTYLMRPRRRNGKAEYKTTV